MQFFFLQNVRLVIQISLLITIPNLVTSNTRARFSSKCFSVLQQVSFNNVQSKQAVYEGSCGRVVVKALYYKPEGRGFETR
jgi:hypothetical protein